MSSPVYYLPGRKSATPQVLAELGLGYLLDGAGGLSAAGVPHSGPDGKAGCMVCLPSAACPEPPIGALAAAAGRAKTFAQLPGSAAWMGWDPASPPGPEDLARREQILGHDVELGDGRRWHVPVARLLDGGTRLPRRLAWDGEVWSPGQVLDRYRALWTAASRIWDALAGAGEGGTETVTVTLDEECSAAAAALAVNYRLGPGEVSLLDLLDEAAEVRVVKALVDWPALDELKKKLEAASPSSLPGGPA